MAEENGSSNTAIVAIVVLVVVGLALAYFSGFFGARDHATNTTIENPTKVIESPTKTIERSTNR